MPDPTLTRASVKISYSASDGYSADFGTAQKTEPKATMLAGIEELARLLALFGFEAEARKTVDEAFARVAEWRAKRGGSMTDRELLEKAAKAAGITLRWPDGVDGVSPRNEADWNWWNPLTDDGDAFRLAVQLEIKVMPCQDDSCAKSGGNAWLCVDNGSDPCAATRLAIVRAAAAIGEQA